MKKGTDEPHHPMNRTCCPPGCGSGRQSVLGASLRGGSFGPELYSDLFAWLNTRLIDDAAFCASQHPD